MRNINEQAFTPEEVKKGLHLKLISSLLELDKDRKDNHFDIRITTDGYCTIVQWCDVSDEFESCGFRFVDSDEVVMREYRFPDGHYEYFSEDTEFEDALKSWLDKNPGWKKNAHGIWFNEDEQKKRLEDLGI